MSCTYNYHTGEISLDFHILKLGEICRRMPLPARVGNNYCIRCKFNAGTYRTDDGVFYKCKHEQATNSEGCESVMRCIYDDLRQEAITHFYD